MINLSIVTLTWEYLGFGCGAELKPRPYTCYINEPRTPQPCGSEYVVIRTPGYFAFTNVDTYYGEIFYTATKYNNWLEVTFPWIYGKLCSCPKIPPLRGMA